MNIKTELAHCVQLLVLTFLVQEISAQTLKKQKTDNVVAEMQVVCHSDSMLFKVNTDTPFNGMVYVKDAPNSCVSEYKSTTNMTFRLPLKSCGTLSAEVDDGIEYFNTVVVQPHMRLMTNQGKGYHIRCKYQTRERTIANTHFNVSPTVATPLLATASMPTCTMKIFRSGRADVAETVKIGDKLIMVIEIDQQEMYGMRVTNCLVRDGLKLAEQQLINDAGCPVDENIMPKFEYTNNFTRAAVSFPAHKFPHVSSVYYQCNVRLCINNGGCTPVECNANGTSNHSDLSRKKRSNSDSRIRNREWNSRTGLSPSEDLSFDVSSNLYVNDMDFGESGSSDRNTQQASSPMHQIDGKTRDQQICMSIGQTSFMFLTVCLITIAVFLLFVCQIGVLGCDKQVGTSLQSSSW